MAATLTERGPMSVQEQVDCVGANVIALVLMCGNAFAVWRVDGRLVIRRLARR